MLPPLKPLIAFEAAVRLGSFTAAAGELHVSQGAISRQIAQLEGFLGFPLFHRDGRQILLTTEGERYASTVSTTLQRLSESTNELVHRFEKRPLTMVTSNAFASLCLMPRMTEISALLGDRELKLIARDDIAALDDLEYDLAVFYCRRRPKVPAAEPLFAEKIVAICSRMYRDSFKVRSDDELVRGTQLWCETPEEWIQWPDWLDHVGLDAAENYKRIQINNYPMVIQAVLDNQGVALGWRGMIDRHLAEGDLVQLTPHEWVTGSSFYLLKNKALNARASAKRQNDLNELLEWLRRSFQNTDS
ncbi:MAG: LysR family transcriptional regulator [Pseudomonadota bacterium]